MEKADDLVVIGNENTWQLLCKTSSEKEGWMKSTKVLEIPERGCLVQVTTQQRNLDGSYTLAEAMEFVPKVAVCADFDGGNRLAPTGLVPNVSIPKVSA